MVDRQYEQLLSRWQTMNSPRQLTKLYFLHKPYTSINTKSNAESLQRDPGQQLTQPHIIVFRQYMRERESINRMQGIPTLQFAALTYIAYMNHDGHTQQR